MFSNGVSSFVKGKIRLLVSPPLLPYWGLVLAFLTATHSPVQYGKLLLVLASMFIHGVGPS
jgi:hypothetical protein